MKVTVSALLLVSSPAIADNILQLSRVGPAEPALTLSDHCTTESDHVRWLATTLDTYKVDVIHDCSKSAAHTELAFEGADGAVRVFPSAPFGAARWAPEQVTFGKLEGGTKALLHSVELRRDDRTDLRIDVCAFDDGAPLCGSVEVTCPETGCKAPATIKGALWVHTKDGRRRYVIEEGRRTQRASR